MKRLYIVCLITLTLVSPVVVTALSKYTVTILPLNPTALNNKGHVVGRTKTSCALWKGRLIPLGINDKTEYQGGISPSALNDADKITINAIGFGAVTSVHPFYWSNGKITEMDGNYGYHGSQVNDINNRGRIVGSTEGGWSEDLGPDAAYWKTSKAKAFNLGKQYKWRHSSADAINIKGDVAGEWTDEKNTMHPYLISKGKLIDLGSIGSQYTTYKVTDLNNNCQVVGYARNDRSKYGNSSHAFLWDKGKLLDIGLMNGYSTIATGINKHGQIVGFSQAKDHDIPFLWMNGKYYDLNTLLIKAVKPKMVRATGINDRGEIIGYCEEKNKIVGVLLKPVK